MYGMIWEGLCLPVYLMPLVSSGHMEHVGLNRFWMMYEVGRKKDE